MASGQRSVTAHNNMLRVYNPAQFYTTITFPMKLFARKPVLDEASVAWLFAVYGWCLKQFDAAEFATGTTLVIPSNEYFPGRENSVQGMAGLIFERVQYYAGMTHWPLQLVDQSWCPSAEPAPLQIDGSRRGGHALATDVTYEQPLPVGYDPAMIGNPEALISSFSHTLAQYLGATAKAPPPGGLQNWPQATEILAVFLGFGLMFANSAFTFRTNKCGSCGGANADRTNYLSQYDVTYALAIFCTLKQIQPGEVLPRLKKSLRSFFKQSMKDIQSREDMLADLMRQLPPGIESSNLS